MKKLFAIIVFAWPLTTLALSAGASYAGNHSGIGPGGTPITTPVTGPKGPRGAVEPRSIYTPQSQPLNQMNKVAPEMRSEGSGTRPASSQPQGSR